MEHVNTPYGSIKSIPSQIEVVNDNVASCVPAEKTTLYTPYGALVPQYSGKELRRAESAQILLHPNGKPRSLPLEDQTIINTPVGEIPAELITFYQNGKLNRIFPLNGKLSGYWGEEDEAALAAPLSIPTPLGTITAKILALSFYKSGNIKSITLWPEEKISIPTPVGPIATRIGVSFHNDGKVKSIEPAKPVQISTTLGNIMAYNPDAVGINGDDNSLEFSEEGEISKVTSTLSGIIARKTTGETVRYMPTERESFCGTTAKEINPLKIFLLKKELRLQSEYSKEIIRLGMDEWTCRTTAVGLF
ncbi:MAG: hypothetical protein ACNI27_10970 [Desulfovibrio sp.]